MRTFSADEVYQMAQEMERNGMAYYSKAADVFSDPEQKKMFQDLVKMEEKHLEDFTAMRDQFHDDNDDMVIDIDNQSGMYLAAITDGTVFDVKEDPTEFIKPDSDIVTILKKAIELEKNSIIFYIGLKDSVPTKSGKEKVEAIIQQEIGHIAKISDKISSLQN